MRIALIDHYDSFTFNLIDWLGAAQPTESVTIDLVAYDDEEAMRHLAADPRPLVISPGPKSPDEARATVVLLEAFLGSVPILGICLGFQMLGRLAGGQVKRSCAPRHGALRSINVKDATGALAGMPSTFSAAAYNSLCVNFAGTLAKGWLVSATCEHEEPQVIEYRFGAGALGLQFHPESFLSTSCDPLRRAWLDQATLWSQSHQSSAMDPLSMPS